MWKIVLVIALVLTVMACSAEVQPSAAATVPAPPEVDRTGHPYPRLGMWWLDPYTASPGEMARYDLLMDSFEDEEPAAKLKQVRALNPAIRVLKPLSPSERSLFWDDDEDGERIPNPEISGLPSGFFLLQTGSALTRRIDANDTVLRLAATRYPDGTPMFHVGGEVAIGDNESAQVLEVNLAANTLTVERGYVRKASRHPVGEKVASHIRFWPGSWVMNVTADCPRVQVRGVDHPVNWVEYYFALITGRSRGIYDEPWENWDAIGSGSAYEGFVLDRFEDKESWLKWLESEDQGVQLDLRQDNTPVSDAEFDRSWQAGTDQLLQLLRQKYPQAAIIRNNPLTERFAPYDGQVYETDGWSDPDSAWWETLFLKPDAEDYYRRFGYLQWFQQGPKTPLVMLEVYEDEGSPEADSDGSYENPYDEPGFVPNYQRMRFSLASALLGNGYYSYEINTDGHGSLGLMWFDEYDNGGRGKGYLGYPLKPFEKLDSGAYQRAYDNGLVLVNPQAVPVTVKLERPYRKIKGTQAPAINDGSQVSQVTLAPFDGLILLTER